MADNFDLGKANYQRVRDAIRNDIITGQFQAGCHLKIGRLVERYGISAMPIREALQQLHGEGLIVFSANRGARVRQIDESFLWHMYEIRKALEMHFVMELAFRVTAADIERLRGILAELQESIAAEDEQRFQNLDLSFHAHIVGATMNGEALAILNRSYDVTRPLRLRFGRSREQAQQVPRDHSAIIDAIAQRDGLRASRLISDHINAAFSDLATAMRLEDDAIRRGLSRD
jgi:DNA-binding GntR family transcriptional regulator